MVKKGEWLPRFECLHPQAHLAELDSHGVNIHPVETMTDDVTEGGALDIG